MHLTVVSQDVQSLSEEDLETFEVFFRGHHVRVIRTLLRLGAEAAEAEDAAIEAFMVLHQAWDRVAPEARFSYVRKVAHRNHMRSAAANRRQSRAAWEEAATEPDVSASAEDGIIEVDETLRMLKSLPPSQQNVLALTYDGFSTAEIADMLGNTLTAVRKSLFRARQKLQDQVVGDSDNSGESDDSTAKVLAS